MRRIIGIDTHRTFGEVVIWEDGSLRHAGRIGMTRTALEGFGKDLLAAGHRGDWQLHGRLAGSNAFRETCEAHFGFWGDEAMLGGCATRGCVEMTRLRLLSRSAFT